MNMPPKTKLFVGMLPANCSEGRLRKLFEEQGEVVECSIMGSYAFVHMKTEDEAQAAITALNQYELDGVNISVEQSTGEKRSGRGGRGGFRGGFRGSRGFGGPMRGGRNDGPPFRRDGGYDYRPGPYDRPDYGRRPMPPHPADRYGPPPMRNGYYDDYDRAPPMDRRPPPPPHYADPYERGYDSYDRRPPGPPAGPPARRVSPSGDRRPIPTVSLTYDRRPEPYDVRGPRDPYYTPPAPQRDLLYPPRVPSPGGGRPHSPPRYGVPRY